MLKLLFIVFIHHAITVTSEEFRARHEYIYSFKGPNLMKGTYKIPFWNYNGDAVAGGDQIRLVPSLRDKSGGIWSKYSFPNEAWQVEMTFRIHGRGKIGADGMAIWLVEKPNESGEVFGYMNKWKGLGVFLDSFDNDGNNKNPYISAMINDGTKQYNHHLDGSDEMLGGCVHDIRNRVYPSKLRLTYWKKNLVIEIDSGNSEITDFEQCAKIENIDIPKDYYFGITAATGGLADDHDVLAFSTSSLHPTETGTESSNIEASKEDDYQKKVDEFESEAKKFREEHPDLAKTPTPDLVEEESSPELKAILDVQSQIKSMIASQIKAMSTVLKRQEEMAEKLAADKNIPTSTDGSSTGSQAAGNVPQDYATKSDLKNIVDSIKLTIEAVEELRGVLKKINDQSGGLSQGIQQLGSRVEQLALTKNPSPYENSENAKKTREQLDYISSLVLDVQAKQKQPATLSCPPPPPTSCLSLGFFMIVAAAQIIILLGYQLYRSAQEASAKKFF